ncbi:MAG: class I tRNA ligase family protein, partial [Neisseriaceae bacterium]|nr:class I tRNA ligase family protein [Neisseriaceae bacterium]
RATEKLFPNGIPAYGTDALRMTMASYASLGRSVNFDFKRCEGYRNFCNKLWNAARFVLMNCDNQAIENTAKNTFADEWILSRLNEVARTTSEAFETYRIDLAAQNLYEFVWNEYCDWYLELAKIQIQVGDEAQQKHTRFVLLQVLESVLRLLHPLIPFITEEIWQTVAPLANAKTVDSIMLAKYPEYQEKPVSGSLKEMATLQEVVNAIRNLRGEMGVAPSVKAPLLLESKDDLSAILPYLPNLAKLTEVRLMDTLPQDEDAPVAVAANARLMLKVEIDKAAETARLNKELEKLQKALDKLNAKLAKPGYTEKAPAHLVAKDREELAGLTEKYDKIKQQLAKLA